MATVATERDSLSAYGEARSTIEGSPLDPDELRRIDAYWRASLYLCLGMIYLKDNPLLREPLTLDHLKTRLLGHWGSDPGQSFVYVHLNRLIKKYDLDAIFLSGPGHGAPALLSNAYLEGTYSEVYPDKSEDADGLRKFFKQFSFPGGIGSHCTPETPGSIHEGGELGYSVSHAYGAAFDAPDRLVVVMVGDGEAETGPLATAWHSNKFLNPARDGAVLPVLHLNGYKINNPSILARISHQELEALFEGYGYTPYFVEGSEPESMHQAMAATLEHCVGEIRAIQEDARQTGVARRPPWPMIVLRSPKGWTAPREVDGHHLEGFWRSHQVPMGDVRENPAHLKILEQWMRCYQPGDALRRGGRLIPELRDLPPKGPRRMSANPATNGGLIRKPLNIPDFRGYAVEVKQPGAGEAEPTKLLGNLLRDIVRLNPTNFRVFCPDETVSNRLTATFEVTGKAWMGETFPEDADGGLLAPDGRVMEMLSEHTLEGWLEGYLLTGRHGFFSTYEAFAHVIDSMVNQHCKWLEKSQRGAVAGEGLVAEPADHLDRLAAGPQRVQPPGPRPARRGRQQEPRGRPRLPAAGRQLPAVGGRPLPAEHRLRQRDRRRQAAAPAVPRHGRRDPALHQGDRHLGLGQQRPGRRARPGDGLVRRRGDDGGPGRDRAAPRALPGPQDPVRQRRRPVPARPRARAPARAVGPGVREPVHPGQAGHLQLPLVPLADPPADLPPPEPAQHPRPGLQGAGEHQHADGAGDPQPDRPVQPGDRRDRPRARRWRRSAPTPGSGCSTARSSAGRTRTSTASTCPRSSGGAGRAHLEPTSDSSDHANADMAPE